MAKAAKAVPEGYHTITPQLTLDNAAQTIDWYKKALGAEEIDRSVGPDGKIMHAELKIGERCDDGRTGAPRFWRIAGVIMALRGQQRHAL